MSISSRNPLGVNVFTAPEKPLAGEQPYPFGPPLRWDPITATLIYGETDAVLVDALTTTAEATALADWVKLHDRNLTTIYLTHGHFDHFYGLGVLLERFPQATAIATPESVQLMHEQLDSDWLQFATQLFPGQIPTNRIAAQPFDGDTFTLEGYEMHIIRQGRTDTVHTTSLHVPTLDLLVAGDVVYNQCHMFVGDTTPQSRANWIAALDRLHALNPKMVVAGHKKTGAPDSPRLPRRVEEIPDRLRPPPGGRQAQRTDLRRHDRPLPGLGQPPIVVDVQLSRAAIQQPMTLHANIVGAWELVSYTERELPDGPLTYPHGPDTLGLIMYTPDGYMSPKS